MRIESLLASFPKLIPPNSQHTSVETSEVRFVYQPLEDLYILLITNKASNILQDIETLHLFARVVADLCRTPDEREIHRVAFELLGAFDEIVSLGYREQVSLMQVRSILEMESHEEKIQEIIARVGFFLICLYQTYYLHMFRLTEQGGGGKRRAQTPRTSTRDATPGTAKTERSWWYWRWVVVPRRGRVGLYAYFTFRHRGTCACAHCITCACCFATSGIQEWWHETRK